MAGAAHPVWPAHRLPERNECMVTHYIRIEKNERLNTSCQCVREGEKEGKLEWGKSVPRTEQGLRRGKEKWQTCWCCQDQWSTYRIVQASTEKLEHFMPFKYNCNCNIPNINWWPQRRWQGARAVIA